MKKSALHNQERMKQVKMRICRLPVFLILFGTLLTAVGCSNDAGNISPTETTGTVQTTTMPETTLEPPVTEAPKPNLEAIAYNREIRALYYKNSTWPVIDIAEAENSGEVLTQALYERNLRVEEKYAVDLVSTELAGSKIITTVQNDVMADDINYDIIMPNMSDTMKMAVNGLLMDVNQLEHNDFTKPWWNSQIISASAIKGINYFAMGDLNLSTYDGTPVVLFNKDIVTNYALEDPYALVRNGKWTLDKMIEMAAGMTEDLDNNTIMNEDDRYGIVCNNFAVDVLLYGCDIQFASLDNDQNIQLSIDQEKLSGVIEKITQLLSAENAYLADRYGSTNQIRETNPTTIFGDNRTLFFPSLLQAVSVLRGGNNNFGILPTPKYNEAQENYTSYVHLYTGSTVCIQRNYAEIDMISRILEDLNYASYETVIPVYIDVALRYKHLNDADSGEMLDIVLDSYTCDIANILRGGGLTLGNDLRTVVTDGSGNIASLIAKNLSVYESSVQAIAEAFKS